MRLVLVSAVLAGLAAPAVAQDTPLPPPTTYGMDGSDIVIELGGGAKVEPAYEGADEYEVEPWPLVDLHYLRIPGLFTLDGTDEQGFFIDPSFDIVDERDDDEYEELEGLDDIDRAYEFGGSIGYRQDYLRGFVTVRKGFGGHEGVVGNLGADLILQPTERVSLTIGPRVNFASDDFMETYFGVSEDEAADSDFDEFDAEGGLKGVEVEAEARFALTEKWSLIGTAGYERLLEDAEDSPITEEGSENQFTAALGLTYRFGLDLFE